jgi:hypothetical protein
MIAHTEEINQFVELWRRVREVILSNQEDGISWRFSANRLYSSSSAYAVQFFGSIADFSWSQLWQAKEENKTKFFCWLAVQNKLWTTDRILKHGGQANPICQLCRTQTESVIHMLCECTYSTAIWQALEQWVGVDLQPPPVSNYRRLKLWWCSMIQERVQGNEQLQERLQKVIYIVWNIWKERCQSRI